MNIGLEIKLLRERANMSSKELAAKIGISQSQMSRLEKGQRRIDAELLQKIAEALNVSPAYFFEKAESTSSSLPQREPSPPLDRINQEIGKLIRAARRKRHLTPEEFAQKIGKNRPYVQALEEGRIDLLQTTLVQKICKVLRLDPAEFVVAYQKLVTKLKKHIHHLSQAYSTTIESSSEVKLGEEIRKAVPIFQSHPEGYPNRFSQEGIPLGEVYDYVYLPHLEEDAFGLIVMDDSMTQGAHPSFREGDIVIFAPRREVLNKDFVFVHLKHSPSLFRQVFFDQEGSIRFQPLNHAYPPYQCSKSEILKWWKLVFHIERSFP